MYYAGYNDPKTDIALFQSVSDRNDWVNYKDSFSLEFGLEKDDPVFERVALTDLQALEIIPTLHTELAMEDLFNKNMRWVINPTF